MLKSRVEIISVGTELLMGQIANTNAQYLSQKLPEIGLGVYFHTVCGDNNKRLAECIKIAESRADIIIFTGGLGPTEDDLTKETVCEYLGLEEVLDNISLSHIKEYFEKTGKVMAESNIKMAMLPKDQTVLKNDFGTAPGCLIKTNEGKIYILLPGPPRELKPMFENYALPLLKENDTHIESLFVNLIGIPESLAEKKMIDLIDSQTNPTFATYAKDGILTIRVTASGENSKELLNAAKKELISIFPEEIYSFDGSHISNVLINKLKEKSLKISTIENYTGGTIAEMLTKTGSSEIFGGGLVLPENMPIDDIDSRADIVLRAKETEEGASIAVDYLGQKLIFNHKIIGDREHKRILTAVNALFDVYKIIKEDEL